MKKATQDTLAHKIVRTSFDSLDAERVAAHKAAFQVHNEDLCARKYVFADGSFLSVRYDEMHPVDPTNADSLMGYAQWIGVASEMEVNTVAVLFNMLEPGSLLVH
jgi:hypothetical protein